MDRPILFSAPMVRALLAGTKTQTRRVFSRKWPVLGKSWAGRSKEPLWAGFGWQWAEARNGNDPHICLPWSHPSDGPPDTDCGWYRIQPPYGPGDRLWVKEGCAWLSGCGYRYRADGADLTEYIEAGMLRWRSPIHMPRKASRLTLTVTDLRVQRLQDIIEEDARAEGLAGITKDGKLTKWGIPDCDGLPGNDDFGWSWEDWNADPRKAYRTIWNSLHGSDAWDANPWVVAITFTVRQGNIDA